MIKVKRLTETAKLPTRAHATDAGLDLYADEYGGMRKGGTRTIRTGIAMAIPNGYVGRIAPRSGLAVNHGIDILAGVIDSAYIGELMVALVNHGSAAYEVKPGDKIAQLLIQPVELWMPEEVDELDGTERGASGFGSSGN